MREKLWELRIGGARALRRVLSLAVCAAMVLAMAPVTARAADTNGFCGAEGDGKSVKWEYDITSRTLTITGTGAMADYNPYYSSGTNPNPTPAPWDAYLGEESGQGIQTVIVDMGVTRIGNYAFDNCDELSSVTIANSVTEIGEFAFSGGNNPRLFRINLPEYLTSIGTFAFSVTNLEEMTIPASVTFIGSKAFIGCRKMASITFLGKPPANMAADASLSLFERTAADCADQNGKLNIHYPYEYRNEWAGLVGNSYGAGATVPPNWTAYGTTELEFMTDFEDTAPGKVVLSVRSSEIPFNESEVLSRQDGVNFDNFTVVPAAGVDVKLSDVSVSADKKELTLTFVPADGASSLPKSGEIQVLTKSAIFEAEVEADWMAGGESTWVIYYPETMSPKLTVSPNPAAFVQKEATVTITAQNCPFDIAKGADSLSYTISPNLCTVKKAELSSDRKSVTLTLKAAIGITGDDTVEIAVSEDAYDLTDYVDGVEIIEPPVSVRLTGATTKVLKLSANPSTVDVSSGTAEITVTSNIPFRRTAYSTRDNYFFTGGMINGQKRYTVQEAEVVDANTVKLTVVPAPGVPEGETQKLIIDTAVFDQSGLGENEVLDIMAAVNGLPITFGKSGQKIASISVTAVWEDDNDKLGKRPESVTVALMRDGVSVNTAVLRKSNNWRHVWTDIALNGSENWTVSEVNVPDGYRCTVSGEDAAGTGWAFQLTNKLSDSTVPDTPTGPDKPANPDKPTGPDKPASTDKTSEDKPKPVKPGEETIPLPGEISVAPKENPPSPVQDMVKTEKVYTEYVDWIERVEPPQFAADLYDVLVSGSDREDTRFTDCLMEDKYFTIDPSADGTANAEVETVEEVEFALSDLYASQGGGIASVIFENDDFFRVDVSKADRGVSYEKLVLGDVVQTSAYNGVFVVGIPKDADFDGKKKETCSYIAAVFQAFDRDHPEVFWLSGKCKVRIASVGGKAYFFLSLADTKGFTMRAPDWTAPGAVASGLLRREEAVQRILNTVGGAGTSAEQLRALNRHLTEHNEYNTSADLNAIGNEPHECLAALEGRSGNSGPVCDGYARAFKVLCDRLGIPCVLENGYAKTSPNGAGTFHMWNSVELGGSWFGVDVTWNDPVVRGVSGVRSGHENERYFLVGANTDILGMTFAASHPVTNQAAVGGVAFDNGPALSPVAFSAMTYQSQNSVGAMDFKDVPIWEWFANPVAYACERGLMMGASDTEFAPNAPLTREQLWMILCRLDGGKPKEIEEGRQWAMAQELSDGTLPTAAITREQMVTTLYRYCKRKGYPLSPGADLSRFPDSGRVEDYAKEAFAWAVGCGLVSGTDEGLLAPQGNATRAQMATILQRFEQCVGQ